MGLTWEDVEEPLHALDTLGVDVERMEMMKQERADPYNHFGPEFAAEENTD